MRTDDEYFDIRFENKEWRKRWHNRIALRSRRRYEYHIRNNMHLPFRHLCYELKYWGYAAYLLGKPLDIEMVAWKVGNNKRRKMRASK